jgi:hypothetical protein
MGSCSTHASPCTWLFGLSAEGRMGAVVDKKVPLLDGKDSGQ